MKQREKKAISYIIAAISLLVAASALRLITIESEVVRITIFLVLIMVYISLLLLWGLSIEYRIMHKPIKRKLKQIIGFMIFWVLIRSFKYRLFPDDDPRARFLWYCYYIPMILIPLLCFLAAKSFDRSENYKYPFKYKWLYLMAGLLIFSVLTNDFHELAFSFQPDFYQWEDSYHYQIIYFLVVFWNLIFIFLFLKTLFEKCRIPENKKQVWMPFLIVLIGMVYSILYIIDSRPVRFGFIEITAMYGLIFFGIWESCIQAGFIPSNIMYKDFFRESNLEMKIKNLDGETAFVSRKWGEGAHGKRIESHSFPIRGGEVVWREDVTEIINVLEELQSTNLELQDHIALLQSELGAKEKHTQLEAKKRLYDLITEQSMPQLDKIHSRLEEMKKSPKEVQIQTIKEMNVIGAYLKRRCNLVLMGEEEKKVSTKDLELCFQESFSNLEICQIEGFFNVLFREKISVESALFIYDLFEQIIEQGIRHIEVMYAVLRKHQNELFFSINIEVKDGFKVTVGEKWKPFLSQEKEGGEEYFSLRFLESEVVL